MSRVQTPYGVFFIDSERDKKMANALLRGEYPNERLLEIAGAFVNEKSVVVDIGAHIGSFTIPIAKVAGKVIAFEPSHETFALLSRNAEENNVQIQLVNSALGSREGTGTMFVRNELNAGANTLVTGDDIPVAMLDKEVTHADFIKIDVEGMELEVLHGGALLIKRARPAVFFEVNLSQLRAHKASPRAIEQFFKQLGYKIYFPFKQENLKLARVRNTTLLTALIAPRAWLFFSESAPFDLLAVPIERDLPFRSASFMSVIRYAIGNNIAVKGKRIVKFLKNLLPTR